MAIEGQVVHFAFNPDQRRGKTTDASTPGSFAPENIAPLTREAREKMSAEELEEYRRKYRERAKRRRENRRAGAKTTPFWQKLQQLEQQHGDLNEFIISDYLGTISPWDTPVMAHNMPKVEMMSKVEVRPGFHVFWGVDTRLVAGRTILELYRNRTMLPDELMAATRGIYLTTQVSKGESLLAKRLGRTTAPIHGTGGDGWIVMYRGRGADVKELAHEMAHNLSTAMYGSTHPPQSSSWAKLWREWKAGTGTAPIRKYGETDVAEAMATAFEIRDQPLRAEGNPWVKAANDLLAEARKKYKIPERSS